MSPKVILLILIGTLNTITALVVFARNPKKLLNAAFFGLALSAAAWVFGIAGFYLAHTARASLEWAQFYYFAPLALVAASAIFADLLRTDEKFTKWSRIKFVLVFGGLCALAIPLLVERHFLSQQLIYHSWGKQVILNQWHYALYSIYIIVCFVWMFSSLLQKMRAARGIYKTQIQILFYGTLSSALLGSCFNLILPWFGNYRLIWIGPLNTALYVAAIAYGIIRHKLFDIHLIVARSMGYLLSVLTLALAYGLLVLLILNGVYKNSAIPLSQSLTFALLAAVLALTFYPARKSFDRVTSKLFYRDSYDPQVFIDHLNKVLVANIDLDKMLTDSANIIVENLKAEYCIFGIQATELSRERYFGTTKTGFSERHFEAVSRLAPNTPGNIIVTDSLPTDQRGLGQAMSRNNAALLAPLASYSKGKGASVRLGYIVLGRKKSGNPYNEQDVKMLDIISRELMIAIQNALHFEEIQNFNLTLQRRVEEATQKLRRTNDKLRKLDETKDDFISMASHQLRTPLTSIKGYTSMVLEGDAGKISPLQRKLLNQAFTSSQRMVYLISDLLNVSRLRTGKFVIEPVPTDLAQVVKDEVDQLVETAKGRSLELTYRRPEHFPMYLLDETKLRQVIMNFIDNAIYYTPSGGHIVVSLVDKPQSVEFTVTDDGIGVPKADQHHLFSKFYRAHNAKQARPDGTGLGLFMAKKVVLAQGGATIFHSQPGQGSTFGFSFAKTHLTEPSYMRK